MKIVAIHSRYTRLGGEDVSHDTEVAALRDCGHDVVDLLFESSELVTESLQTRTRNIVFNTESFRRVSETLRLDTFDIVYVNNTFPFVSTSVLSAARAAGVASVQVLRNYRRECLSGNLFRGGEYCDDCVGRSLKTPGVRHGCYRESRAASAIAAGASLIRRRVSGSDDAATLYIGVSRHVRDVAIEGGLDPQRVVTRPNLVWPDPQVNDRRPASAFDGSRTFVFVGRDTPEKGLSVLLRAFRSVARPSDRLVIVGDIEAASTADPRIIYLGQTPHEVTLQVMADADRVVVPSVWAEPFGRVAIESLAVGTPVIASAAGGLADLESGNVQLVAPGSEADLALAISRTPSYIGAEARRVADACKAEFREEYSIQPWRSRTEDVFDRAMRMIKDEHET